NGQTSDESVLRRRTQPRHFQCLCDPLDHLLPLDAARLRQALRRHASIANPSPYRFPDLKMPVLELRVELIDADARGTQIGVVARDAILLKEWRDNLVERRLESFRIGARRLPRQEAGGHPDPQEREQSEGWSQSKPTIPGCHIWRL